MDHFPLVSTLDVPSTCPLPRCRLRLEVPACAQNVPLARRAVQEISVRLGFSDRLVSDIRLAVTEACTNVVRHAYDEGGGMLTLKVDPEGSGLRVEVCDSGCGQRSEPSPESAGLGMGLIAALSSEHEIVLLSGQGRTVRMFFAPSTGRFTSA